MEAESCLYNVLSDSTWFDLTELTPVWTLGGRLTNLQQVDPIRPDAIRPIASGRAASGHFSKLASNEVCEWICLQFAWREHPATQCYVHGKVKEMFVT